MFQGINTLKPEESTAMLNFNRKKIKINLNAIHTIKICAQDG